MYVSHQRKRNDSGQKITKSQVLAMLATHTRHLVPHVVCPGVRVGSVLDFIFLTGFMKLNTVRYLDLDSLTIYNIMMSKLQYSVMYIHLKNIRPIQCEVFVLVK